MDMLLNEHDGSPAPERDVLVTSNWHQPLIQKYIFFRYEGIISQNGDALSLFHLQPSFQRLLPT